MIRQPTTFGEMFAWHRAVLAGQRPAIHDADPQAGWFKTQMVRGGPFVPARIWLEREICPVTGELTADEKFHCEIDGQRRDAWREWVWLAKRPIPKAEFEELTNLKTIIPAMQATHVNIDISREVMRAAIEEAIIECTDCGLKMDHWDDSDTSPAEVCAARWNTRTDACAEVKPLVWDKHPDDQEWYCVFPEIDHIERGYMVIYQSGYGGFVLYDGFSSRRRKMGLFTTETLAFRAAQKHHEKQTIAATTTRPAAEVRKEAHAAGRAEALEIAANRADRRGESWRFIGRGGIAEDYEDFANKLRALNKEAGA